MRVPVPLPPLPVLVVVLGVFGLSCLDLSWKEGIACSGDGKCPGGLTCCRGACMRQCTPSPGDAGHGVDGDAPAVTCPAMMAGCFPCTPGCACVCGGIQMTCCMQLGIGSCGGCR